MVTSWQHCLTQPYAAAAAAVAAAVKYSAESAKGASHDSAERAIVVEFPQKQLTKRARYTTNYAHLTASSDEKGS